MYKNGYCKPRGGQDVGDHPPITPTSTAPSDLYGDEARIYNYVAAHFLATISQDAKMVRKVAKFELGNETFTLEGSTLTSKGFTEIMPWITISENPIPDFIEGESYKIGRVDVD